MFLAFIFLSVAVLAHDCCELRDGWKCLECGHLQVLVEGLCLTRCPDGYQVHQQQCLFHSNQTIHTRFEPEEADEVQKIFQGAESLWMDKKRGAFLDRNSKLTTKKQVLISSQGTFSFWIFVETPGFVLFSQKNFQVKVNRDEISFFAFGVVRKNMLKEKHWQKIEFLWLWQDCGLFVTFRVAGFTVSGCERIDLDYVIQEEALIIGGLLGFEGFLYSFYLSNRAQNAPDYLDLVDCQIHQYFFDGECNECKGLGVPCKEPRYTGSDILKHYNPRVRRLDHCLNCLNCPNSDPNPCLECDNPYKRVFGLCITNNPTFITADTTTYSQTKQLIFNLDLSNKILNDVVDTASNIATSSGLNSNFHPNYDSNDPYPAKERGYYFNGNSHMTLSTTLMFAPEFSFVLWVSTESASAQGCIFNKPAFVSLCFSSGYIELKALVSSIFTSTTQLINSAWYNIAVSIQASASGTYSVTFYFNANLIGGPISQTIGILDDTGTAQQYIGSSSASTDRFTGFILILKIYNICIQQALINSEFSSTSVPSVFCPITTYVDGTSCPSCSCTYSCCRSDRCNLCYSERCITCTGYSQNDCTSCISNASGNSCDCSSSFFWDSTNKLCSACQSHCTICTSASLGSCSSCDVGYNLVQGVCIQTCPSGYTTPCTYSNDFVFNLDLNDKILDYWTESQSSITISTGVDSKFYHSNDPTDPYPTKERGYYFQGFAYLKDSSNSLKLAPENTIFAWIRPEISDAVLFAKQGSSDQILYSLELSSGYLKCNLGTQNVISTSTVDLNKWNFVGVKMEISSNFVYNAYFQISSVPNSVLLSGSGYFDDTSTSFKILIGGSYPLVTGGYIGFIWKLKIYNSKTPDLSTLSSSVIFPPECSISQFYDSGSCSNCNNLCSTGCVRNDIKCNLCFDQQCATCENFSTCLTCITNASGSPCECSAGYFWKATIEECASCTLNCDSCTDENFNSCVFCSSGYFLSQSVCVLNCPAGYSANSATRVCDLVNNPGFSFKPEKIEDQVTAAGFTMVTGDDASFYPNYKITDPYAAKYRGYYFTGTSYVQGPPNRADSAYVNVAPQFTITCWVRPVSTGVILIFQDASDTQSLTLEIDSSTKKFQSQVMLDSSKTLQGTQADLKGWNFVSMKGFINSSPSYQISLSVNGTESLSTNLGSTFYSQANQYLTIGAKRSGASFTGYFTGFIYEIKIYAGNLDLTTVLSSSCSGCSYCPISASCLPNCPITHFFDSTKCSICKATCFTKGCVRFDTSCNLCNDQLCSVCYGYTEVCTTCKAGATLVSNICTCDTGYAFSSVTEDCQLCPSQCSACTKSNAVSCTACNSGFYLLEGTCQSNCPWGYSTSGSSCVLDSRSGYVFSLFMEKIEDFVEDSQSNLKVTTGTDSNFYPNYGSNDPLATKRGYYFTGSSFMSLPPNYEDSSTLVLFSPVFTFSSWIRYSSPGIIFIKQMDSNPYTHSIKVYIAGTHATVSLYLDNAGTKGHSELSCSTEILKDAWQQLAFTISLNDASQITCMIHSNTQSSQQIGFYLLSDFSSSYTITIGAQKTSSYSSFITGFIYSLKIWTKIVDPISLDYLSQCPPTGCIPNCGIGQYYDGACRDCLSSCASVGCVRPDQKCNLCSNQKCSSCTDFTTSCLTCISNAAGTPSCNCISSFYFDSVLEECKECPSTCSSCTSSSLVGCTGCSGTTFSLLNLCRNFCPSGYSTSTSPNSCILSNSLILNLKFDSISGVVTDKSPLSLKATTGSTLNFYPNYDSNDPKASRYRGYYFDGVSSVVNLPPFGLFSSPKIYFSPVLTIESWVFPTSASGTVLCKQDITNFAKIVCVGLSSNSAKLTGYFDSLGISTFTCSVSLTQNSWNYLGIKLFYVSTQSTATCTVGTTSGTTSTLGTGFLDDSISSYKFTVGAASSSSGSFELFSGFIYQVAVRNSDESLSEFSNSCTGGCSLCPVSTDCLVSCLFSEYWTGGNHNSCSSCYSGCGSSGCLSSSVACNLCNDIRCKVCTDYSPGTCTECILNANNLSGCTCNSGYYWNSVTETCDACHSTCATCSSFGFMLCDTCKPGLVRLNGACHPFCPSGFSENSGSCSEVNSPAFNAVFEKISGVIYDSVSSIPVVTGSTSVFSPTMESSDPYPLKDRGYYFTGSSLMRLPPSAEFASPVFQLGNSFTLVFWVTWISDGTLLAVQSDSFAGSLVITLSSQPFMSIRLLDSNSLFTHTCQTNLNANWNYLVFYLELQATGDTYAKCQVNTNVGTASLLSNGYHVSFTSFFTLGAKVQTSSAFSSFFSGYLYSLKIFNTYFLVADTTSTCDKSQSFCTLCPSSTATCINKCAHNKYWDGSTCAACTGLCKSCVRSDSVCNLCFDEICYICTDFISGTCTQCKPNALLNSGSCTCNQYYFWDNINKQCSKCDSKCATCTGTAFLDCLTCKTGSFWFYDICLSTCPKGFTSNSATLTCDQNYLKVLSLSFDTLNGQPTDSSPSTITAKAGTSSTNFYPSYDSDDPFGTYKRGFYFTGSSKVFLPPYTNNPLPLLTLAPDLNIAVWVRPSSDGCIISHQVNAIGVAQVFVLSITSSKAVLLLRMSTSGTLSVSSASVTLGTWVHVGFIVKVTRAVGTSVSPYLNLALGTVKSYAYDYFNAQSNNLLWIIGTRYSTTSSYSNFFTGFIFSIEIWNHEMTTADWGLSTTCVSNPNACSACPASSGTCLPDCDLNQFYDPVNQACGPCKASCLSGCRDATYCNLCADPICNNCNDVNPGSCIDCKPNTKSGVSPCTCNTLYIWFDLDETCSKCYSGCTLCTSPIHNACTSCSTDYFLTYNECLNFCPTLFVKDSVNQLCTPPSDLYVFKLDMANVIYGELEDSKSGFKVMTGTSSNFYPNYDTTDPIAADSRGYYFTGTSFLDVQNSASNGLLSFPSKLTVGIWFNHMSDGTLFCKQHNPNLSKHIELLIASNKLSMNLILTTGPFTSSSSATLPKNFWHYIVTSMDIDSSANTVITFSINGVSEASLTLAQDYFKDISTSFFFLIGARHQTSSIQQNFFTGYLWRVSFWQGTGISLSSEFSSTCPGCSFCPPSTCLSTCTSIQLSSDCSACPSCATITCVLTSTCNICQDLKCLSCKDYTSTGCTACKANAEFTSAAGSLCKCSSGYSWSSATESCEVCANLCSPCVDFLTTGCSACVPGAFFHSSVCMPFCPTGFSPDPPACSGTNKLVLQLSFLKIKGVVIDSVTNMIQLVTGTSSAFYPNYEADDPFAANARGYYFDGSKTYMKFVSNANNNMQMVFSPTHSVGYWILPYTDTGVLLSKQDGTSPPSDYLKFELVSGKINLTFKFKLITTLFTHSSTDSVTLDIWNHVGYSLEIKNNNCEVITSINGVSSAGTVLTAGHYEDLQSGYLFTVGATHSTTSARSGYFKGYINEIKIWTLVVTFSTELGTCSTCHCPSSTNVCISTCPYTQYIVNGACLNCDPSCLSGCVRSSDCNLCYNKLCSSCQDFESAGCVTCKTNADLIIPSNSCQCKLGSYEDSSTSQCLLCFSYCETCTSGKNGDCLSCKSGNFMNPETGLCLTTCPIGYIGVGNVCAVDPLISPPIVFQFTKLTNVMPDTKEMYGAYMGSSNAFFGAFDANDPLPIYGRGVYFKGSSFASLPPNTANKTSLIMGNHHTLTMWVRPQSHTTDLYTCSKEDGTNIRLSLYFDKTTLQTKSTYMVFSDTTSASSVINALGPTLPSWDTWVEAAVTLQRTGYSTEVRIYLNGVAGAVSSLPNTFFQDADSNTFFVGQSKTANKFFKGFIFEVKLFNSIVPVAAPSTSCGCAGCTSTGTCLLSCGYLEYFESSCKPCLNTCSTGCINGKNCNMNLDKLCSTSTGFTPNECTSCIALSTGAGNGCQCLANSFYNSDSGVCDCVQSYTPFQNECVPCFYHLQKVDIAGFFSNDYLGLVFNMTFAVKSTTSSDCKDLFESASFLMLGSSPKCSWSTNRTVLTVTLGPNATVARSPVTFKAKSLYTNVALCGIEPTAVTVNIDFIYPVPEIIPNPWLFAPLTTYIQCDDLFLDGSKSSNGFNRPLLFSWIFVSTPKLAVLSGYEESSSKHSSLFFNKSVLASTSVKVTMKVTNWLDKSSSITQSIQVIAGTGLHLILDGDTKWVMRSSDTKTIFIQATSSCVFSNSLSYSWAVSSFSGNYSGYDNVALTKDQTVPSRIYIPPKVFKPGFYTFQVNVTDNAKGMSGSTQFTITVQPQDLLIILPAEHFTADSRGKFSVSGEKCSDPDLLTEAMKYEWTCVVDAVNCSSLILDPASKVLTINSGLVPGKTYSMRLTVSKDLRTAYKDFTVKAVNFSTPVVTFSINNEIVNSQLPVRILAEVSGAGVASYLWSLESGGAVLYTTPLKDLEIGLRANSLTQGMRYVFRFEVTIAGQISAFKTSFVVMKQPAGGSLSVSPKQGTEYSTVFLLTAPGWVDSDSPETGILTYQFGYNLDNQVYILNIRNQSSFLYTRLPYSPEPVVLWVRVLNRQGGYSLATTTVSTIKSKEDLGSQALSSLSNILNNELSDPAGLPVVIGYTALYYLSNETKASAEKQQAFEQVLSGIDRMIQTTVNCQYQDIQNLLDVMNSVTSQFKPESYSQISSKIKSILALSQSSGVVIDTAQLQSYINIIIHAAGLSNSLFRSGTSSVFTANEDIKQVLMAAADHLALGESLFYYAEQVQVHASCYSAGVSNYSSPSVPGRKGSVQLKNQSFPVSNPLMFIFILYDDDGKNSSNLPTGLDFSIVELTATGKKILDLDLSPPVELQIPILNYTQGKVQCVYHKSNWSDFGCSLVKLEASLASCTCNHTSLFAAGTDLVPYVPPPIEEEPAEEADKSSWLLLFYYLCGLLGAWIIISSVLLIIDQNEFARRKRAEEMANQRYQKWYKSEEPVQNLSRPEKKMNETLTVDQNPTFFKKLNYDADIIVTSRKEANPFLNPANQSRVEPSVSENSFMKQEEAKGNTQAVNDQDSSDRYLTQSKNPFAVHYFLSFFIFHDPYYARFVRSLVLFTSLAFQCFFLGIFVTLLKDQLEIPKRMKLSEVLHHLNWVSGLLSLGVAVFCNLLTWPFQFAMKNIVNVHQAGQTMVRTRSKCWKILGIAVSMGSLGFCIFSTYFISNLVYSPQSVMWFCLTMMSLLTDLLVIQSLKIILVCFQKRRSAQATVVPDTLHSP